MAQQMKQRAKEWLKKTGPLIDKFKYPALILLLGLFLMLLPGKKAETADSPETVEETVSMQEPTAWTEEDYRCKLEQELAAILSQIDGAGQVQVMLTLKSSAAVQYQSDYDTVSQPAEGSASTKQSTVILSRGSAYDEAAVVKTEYPVFHGALIVSEGADNAMVRLALENAVAALLGLGTDKITVVKMK